MRYENANSVYQEPHWVGMYDTSNGDISRYTSYNLEISFSVNNFTEEALNTPQDMIIYEHINNKNISKLKCNFNLILISIKPSMTSNKLSKMT